MKASALAVILALCASCISLPDGEVDDPGFDTSVPPPEITSQLAAQIVEEGEDAVFEIEAEGQGPLSYRWYRFSYDPADPFTLELVPGATDPVYLLAPTVDDDRAGFICVVTGIGGEMWSKPAILRVVDDCLDD
jgi:hypothetical protein